MNKQEAKKVLSEKVTEYRSLNYERLRAKINQEKDVFEIKAPSGATYYIDIIVVWDDKPNGIIRVMGCIDDGGFRAFFPMGGEGFLLAPNGSFVGEDDAG